MLYEQPLSRPHLSGFFLNNSPEDLNTTHSLCVVQIPTATSFLQVLTNQNEFTSLPVKEKELPLL